MVAEKKAITEEPKKTAAKTEEADQIGEIETSDLTSPSEETAAHKQEMAESTKNDTKSVV